MISLRVYNYAKVPRPILLLAEQNASTIFRGAGVETTWLDCRTSLRDAQFPACERPLGPTDLFLKLLSPSMAQAIDTHDEAFGLLFASKRPTDAFILYGRVMELEKRANIREHEVLAAVMAHEIGHVLGATHSPDGIMRANWASEQLNLLHMGMLQFTSEQALHIRANVLLRMGCATKGVVSMSQDSVWQ